MLLIFCQLAQATDATLLESAKLQGRAKALVTTYALLTLKSNPALGNDNQEGKQFRKDLLAVYAQACSEATKPFMPEEVLASVQSTLDKYGGTPAKEKKQTQLFKEFCVIFFWKVLVVLLLITLIS